MNDRDHFAAAALTGLLAGPAAGPTQKFSEFAQEAYRIADAMLAERANYSEKPNSCETSAENKRAAETLQIMTPCQRRERRTC